MIIQQIKQNGAERYLIVMDDNEIVLGYIYPNGWLCRANGIMSKHESPEQAINALRGPQQ